MILMRQGVLIVVVNLIIRFTKDEHELILKNDKC